MRALVPGALWAYLRAGRSGPGAPSAGTTYRYLRGGQEKTLGPLHSRRAAIHIGTESAENRRIVTAKRLQAADPGHLIACAYRLLAGDTGHAARLTQVTTHRS